MDKLDPRYDVEMRELIFSEHNRKKFIYGRWFMLVMKIKNSISFGVDTTIYV